MSGCAQEANKQGLVAALRAARPGVSGAFEVMNDTVGSIFTASASGGLVLIAGTGSMGQLLRADGSSDRCGGWGHVVGDEGSAYWIASRAIKHALRWRDGFVNESHDASRVWDAILSHFGVDSTDGIVEHLYRRFDKAKIAGLTQALAALAAEGDALSLALFAKAGRALGSVVRSLAAKMESAEEVRVLAVGSVWKSLPLLEAAFKEAVRGEGMRAVEIVALTEESDVGAAWRASSLHGGALQLDWSRNTRSLLRIEWA